MMQTIIQMADIFKKMGIPRGDWRRSLNLGWDSHVVKDMLGYCPHTKRLVGAAYDAFDLDVISKEFKRRYKCVELACKNNNEDPEFGEGKTPKKEESKLQLGKHYMVFMARTITSKSRLFCFMVARYCLSSLTAN